MTVCGGVMIILGYVFFVEPADKSVLEWTPSGPQPSMQDSKVQSKINSMVGKTSIVIPPELEEKCKIIQNSHNKLWNVLIILLQSIIEQKQNQGFLITLIKMEKSIMPA